jgi:hypothetical protein
VHDCHTELSRRARFAPSIDDHRAARRGSTRLDEPLEPMRAGSHHRPFHKGMLHQAHALGSSMRFASIAIERNAGIVRRDAPYDFDVSNLSPRGRQRKREEG